MALTAVFLHSGQVCSAGARLIVEESIHDEFVDELVDRARQHPARRSVRREGRDRRADLAGRTCDKVEAYVAAGVAEGAVLRCGGTAARRPGAGRRLLLPAHGPRRLHQRHVGRPGRVVRPGAHRRDVHRRGRRGARSPTTASTGWPARSGPRTPARAERVAARLRMGTVWINDYHPYVPQAEWGGYKQSGIGRELGQAGLEEYRETKHVWHNIRPAPSSTGSDAVRLPTEGSRGGQR